jgi:hypothetical protein
MVLEAAVNGQANAIVTFNRRGFRLMPEQFGIEIILPGAAVERLGDYDAEEQLCAAASTFAPGGSTQASRIRRRGAESAH